MARRNPLAKAEKLVHETAVLAQKKGLALDFAYEDLGDLYHIHGVNATPSKLLKMLIDRKKTKAAAGNTYVEILVILAGIILIASLVAQCDIIKEVQASARIDGSFTHKGNCDNPIHYQQPAE